MQCADLARCLRCRMSLKTKNLLLIVVAALGSFAVAADKADKKLDSPPAASKNKASSIAKPSPYLKKNISGITGKVTSAAAERAVHASEELVRLCLH